MITISGLYFEDVYTPLRRQLLFDARKVDVGSWHSVATGNNPMLVTRELEDVSFEITVPKTVQWLKKELKPNLPWAEAHFAERMAGPANPGEQYKNWPWYKGNVDKHRTQGEAFSHTYMERYWPKEAGTVSPIVVSDRPVDVTDWKPGTIMTMAAGTQFQFIRRPARGIRFEYGDVQDVVTLLRNQPLTRQAYLPVWFPEDTGVVHGERVPCSLGYHFMIRDGHLTCRYYLRSCDFVRHFRDDIYLTARLMQWMVQRLDETDTVPGLRTGKLIVHISSLHIMEGDIFHLTEELKNS